MGDRHGCQFLKHRSHPAALRASKSDHQWFCRSVETREWPTNIADRPAKPPSGLLQGRKLVHNGLPAITGRDHRQFVKQ